ncbi:MAG: DUF5103 domain-containing protein [Bacteroidales bacterium]|jgi:hypothetical protein|nr:DUF5103 domain-containing protein [Bacteroidales bacterium]
MKKFIYITILLLAASTNAQSRFEEKIYNPLIKSVKMEVEGTDFSFPVIDIEDSKRLVLKFDELSNEPHRYEFKIIHCNADWTQSDLQPMEYIEGFETGMLESYAQSFNTLQRYVHYELVIPYNIKFIRSGNYLLKVFNEYEEDKVILTRYFYVCDNSAFVQASVFQARNPATQRYNQEIDVSLTPTDGFSFYNPNTNIKVLVMQNGRRDNKALLQMRQTKGQSLDYSFFPCNEFEGGNEFRNFDITSLRSRSSRVRKIDYINDENQAFLVNEPDRSHSPYISAGDLDGAFYIRNDYMDNFDITSDYCWVHFTFPTQISLEGSYYIVGELTDWHLTEQNKMSYDKDLKAYRLSLFLKQGFYDYAILFYPSNSRSATFLKAEGSHSETNNTYRILAYYRKPGDTHDSLAGYTSVVTKF